MKTCKKDQKYKQNFFDEKKTATRVDIQGVHKLLLKFQKFNKILFLRYFHSVSCMAQENTQVFSLLTDTF